MKKVEVRDLVVVNDLPDTQVYSVKAVTGRTAFLVYKVGTQMREGGLIDIDSLQKPTVQQLTNALKSFYPSK